VEYVYFMASLPSLTLTAPPLLSSRDMVTAAGGVLREDHRQDLRALAEGRPQDARSPEARALVDAEARLRAALAKLRARRAGAESAGSAASRPLPDTGAANAAAGALALDDPLDRELFLDRYRWELLDAAAAIPGFGVQAVFAYALKLRLAEKWSAMNDEAGMAVVRSISDDNAVRCGL
jgi:hypothetical protein